jgi:hypothetical protein
LPSAPWLHQLEDPDDEDTGATPRALAHLAIDDARQEAADLWDALVWVARVLGVPRDAVAALLADEHPFDDDAVDPETLSDQERVQYVLRASVHQFDALDDVMCALARAASGERVRSEREAPYLPPPKAWAESVGDVRATTVNELASALCAVAQLDGMVLLLGELCGLPSSLEREDLPELEDHAELDHAEPAVLLGDAFVLCDELREGLEYVAGELDISDEDVAEIDRQLAMDEA